MAVAFVKSTTSAEGSLVSSIATSAFTGSTSSGNAIVATGAYYDPDGTVAGTDAWTDNKSNSYTNNAAAQTFGGGAARISIGYGLNITGGSSHTVTFTPGDTGLYITAGAMEFSGVATSAAGDGTNSATGSSAFPSTGSITPANNGVVVGMVGYDGSATTIANFGGSWTLAYEIDENNDAADQNAEYQLSTGGASYSGASTLGSSKSWGGCIIGLKEATGGGGGSTSPGYYRRRRRAA